MKNNRNKKQSRVQEDRKRSNCDVSSSLGRCVVSEVKAVSLFGVYSDPKLQQIQDQQTAERHARNRELMRKWLEKAGERKIVRDPSGFRGCFWIGLLVRETKNFYVYDEFSLIGDNPFDLWGEKRISKRRGHLVACDCCPDHPQSRCPGRNPIHVEF